MSQLLVGRDRFRDLNKQPFIDIDIEDPRWSALFYLADNSGKRSDIWMKPDMLSGEALISWGGGMVEMKRARDLFQIIYQLYISCVNSTMYLRRKIPDISF